MGVAGAGVPIASTFSMDTFQSSRACSHFSPASPPLVASAKVRRQRGTAEKIQLLTMNTARELSHRFLERPELGRGVDARLLKREPSILHLNEGQGSQGGDLQAVDEGKVTPDFHGDLPEAAS